MHAPTCVTGCCHFSPHESLGTRLTMYIYHYGNNLNLKVFNLHGSLKSITDLPEVSGAATNARSVPYMAQIEENIKLMITLHTSGLGMMALIHVHILA